MTRAWHGRWQLKRNVLAQIDGHLAGPSVAPIRVGEIELAVYANLGRADLDALRAALGIPVSVLAIGTNHGCLIENESSARLAIEAIRDFFQAVPVGAELGWVVAELAALRLVDQDEGLARLVDDGRTEALLRRVAEALRHGLVDDELREKVDALLQEWSAEVRRQWEQTNRVEPVIQARVKALKVAKHACDVPTDPFACVRVLDVSLSGTPLAKSTGSWDSVTQTFYELMAGR